MASNLFQLRSTSHLLQGSMKTCPNGESQFPTFLTRSDLQPCMSSWSFSRSDLLQLAFSHAQILVHRPFLINSLNSLSGQVQENGSGRLRHEEIRKNVQLCVDAATEITKHVNYINDAGELYSTLFLVSYYGFSAVVILYVFAIQRRTETPETCLDCFRLASQCHAQIESIATNGSLMQRYGVVLQELRLEVLRNNTYLAPVSNPRAGNCLTSNENNEILPVPYRRSQLRPEGGTSGSRLAVEQAAEGAPFCRSFPCFSRRTLQHDKLGTIRFTTDMILYLPHRSQVGLEILMRWFTTTPPIFGATAAT
ncbi:finger protein [Colletotrichum abscissum]|uniref:finger protein n=1 Tax=Colletotrichum abscissum TaxID=1671311 RepID=UPI0027D4A8C3|nr:finger protein [Colletotrichum abscissum]KAK1505524.1 finger protein [Colletotrichum abscissum]